MKSKKSFWKTGIVMVAILVVNVSAIPSQAQEDDCKYFEDGGHYVCTEFLEFFETRGGPEIFGYPLTEAFNDPDRGLWVQYFQRVRMEWHPYNPEPYKVQLGLLVDDLGYRFPDALPGEIPLFNSHLRHYFPETKHVVSYAFLDYFREHGGLDIFGYPRSEPVYEGGHLVQYFQRARMEWRPESPFGLQMYLTNLGETYIERFDVPQEYIEERDPERGADLVTELDVSASVRHAITGPEGSQTVFVYVTNQRQKPVSGAEVVITVRYEPGEEHDFVCSPTDLSGFSERDFDIPSGLVLPGHKVVIDVVATYGGLTGTTQTSFLPWW